MVCGKMFGGLLFVKRLMMAPKKEEEEAHGVPQHMIKAPTTFSLILDANLNSTTF
jgi:hypothetical protein